MRWGGRSEEKGLTVLRSERVDGCPQICRGGGVADFSGRTFSDLVRRLARPPYCKLADCHLP